MKKNLYLLTLLLAIFGCQQPEVKKEKDLRPENEITFVNKFNEADSIYHHQINDLRKSEVLVSAENALSDYIIKDLNLKADGWITTVNEITLNGLDHVEADLLVKTHDDPDEKHPELSSIVLLSNVNYKAKKVVEVLRTLKANDKVIITGKFVETAAGVISLLSHGFDDTFSNPKIVFELTDIKKTH